MVKLDHLAIKVRNYVESRNWYIDCFGFKLEFETSERKTAALLDANGLTLFLEEARGVLQEPSCTLFLQVDDVDAKHRELRARGVLFDKAPQRLFWGYGAELLDPSGYRIGLWDEASMRDKGGH